MKSVMHNGSPEVLRLPRLVNAKLLAESRRAGLWISMGGVGTALGGYGERKLDIRLKRRKGYYGNVEVPRNEYLN